MRWIATPDEPFPSLDTLQRFAAAASQATPLYVEWRRLNDTTDRRSEDGMRRVAAKTIVSMEVCMGRALPMRSRRDRRDGRKDFRYFVSAAFKAYANPAKAATDLGYFDGFAVRSLLTHRRKRAAAKASA